MPLDNENPGTSAQLGEEAEQKPLEEGVDYYLENGLFVFTADFLRRRGYCCESGCRHCPYEPDNK